MKPKTLPEAASAGNLQAIRWLLAQGTDPNQPGDRGRSPLLEAAELGHEQAVAELLAAGADPNRAADNYQTPLGQAAGAGRLKIVQRLREGGAAIEGYGFGATTPLIEAASLGRTAVIQWLLEQGADPNARGSRGITALLLVAGQGKTTLVESLLNRGADPNLANEQGFTPLHAAMQRVKMATVQLLLRRGADVNAASTSGMTALMSAIQHGREKLVEAILKAGANPNLAYRENDAFFPHLVKGATPLHVAVHLDKLELVNALLQTGADANLRDDRGATPLDIAEAQGFGDIVDRLTPLTQGSENRRPDPKTLGPRLFRAALAGRAEEVRTLLALGADPDSIDPKPTEQGRTALIAACQEGHEECARVLIDAGADVERATQENAWLGRSRSPLIAASEEGRVAIVQMLLDAGANVDGVDSVGDTALTLAAEQGRGSVARLLLAAGADPNHLPGAAKSDENDFEDEYDDYDGGREGLMDALSRALQNDHLHILDEFLKAGATPSPRSLLVAAQMGRAEMVRRLLGLGLNLNAAVPESGGRTSLHAACSLQTTVLERDFQVNIIDAEPETYLTIAASWQLETVQLLLERGADPNARDAQGRTPMHAAAGMETMVTYRHVRDPDAAAKHTSSQIDTSPIIRLLLKHGADPNIQDRDGFTPLIRACRADGWGSSPLPIIETLLRAGADVNLRDAEGRTALFPISRANRDIVKRLLQAGADVNIRDSQGRTALLQTIENAYDQIEVLQLLLDAGSDLNARDRDGRSAMELAQEHQAKPIIKLLTKAGAVAESPIHRRLYNAVAAGSIKQAQAALRAGADPHVVFHSWDALRLALSQGKTEIAALLLKAGADVNRRSDSIYYPTPLFAAIQNEAPNLDPQASLNLVKMLLDAGADPNVLNSRGRSPLTYAAWGGRRDWVEALLASGADVAADPLSQDFLNVLALAEGAKTPEFAEAIAIARAATGAEPRPIEWRPGLQAFFVTADQETDEAMRSPEASGMARFGVEWNVLNQKVHDLCRDLRTKLAPLGASVLDLGRPIGCGPSGKFVVVLPSLDPFTALAACGPSPGGDYGGADGGGLALPDVVAWFRDLARRIPFTIWGAGRDFVDVEFGRPIPDEESRDLAQRIYEFCPDSVSQGAGTKAKLARAIRETQRVYFWWD